LIYFQSNREDQFKVKSLSLPIKFK